MRVSWKALDKGCYVPSANRAFLEISQIKSTGTTRDVSGLFKYTNFMFKKSILNLEERCLHSNLIIQALTSGKNFKPYIWENESTGSKGKIVIFSTRSYMKKFCRDYYSYITANNKKHIWKGTACVGSRDTLAPYPDLISRVGKWHFYNFYNNQAGSNPVKNENLYAFTNPERPEIRRQLFKFHCSRNPSAC